MPDQYSHKPKKHQRITIWGTKGQKRYTSDNPRPKMGNIGCKHCHRFPWHHVGKRQHCPKGHTYYEPKGGGSLT